MLATLVLWTAAGVAIVSLVWGQIRLSVAGTVLFKSSGLPRPLLTMVVFAVLAKYSARIAAVAVVSIVLSVLPFDAYWRTLNEFSRQKHSLRTASECVLAVQAEPRNGPRGLVVDVVEQDMVHPLYYYFRRIRPWERVGPGDVRLVDRSLHDPAGRRPVLISNSRYQAYAHSTDRAPSGVPSPPMAPVLDVLLLLPGPYEICSPDRSLK